MALPPPPSVGARFERVLGTAHGGSGETALPAPAAMRARADWSEPRVS